MTNFRTAKYSPNTLGIDDPNKTAESLLYATSAESYGVDYDTTPALNVARMNAALRENRVVTLTTPGQYLFGGPGQDGILIPSNTHLICAAGVELVLADQTFTPLIRNANAFDAGLVLGVAVVWSGASPFFSASITKTGIGLTYPVGSRFGLLGLAGSNANNRNYQGVYKVTAATADSITFKLLGAPPSGGNSATTGIIYPADYNIRITGGLWDGNETGQSGNPNVDGDPITHIMAVRNAQNVLVENVKFRKGEAWCLGTNNIRDCTFRDIEGDLSGPSVAAHDVVHIAGGARNVLIERVTADCDDNIIGMTLDGLTNNVGTPLSAGYLSRYYPGDTYDIVIRDIHGRNTQASIVALWGNNDYHHHSTTIERVTGQSSSGGVQINTPYNPTNMLNVNGGTLTIRDVIGTWNGSAVDMISDGTWDTVRIENIKNTSVAGASAIVNLARTTTAQAIRSMSIRNVDWRVRGAGSTGKGGPVIKIENSSIESLTIEQNGPVLLGANHSLVRFTGSAGVIKRAVIEKCVATASATGTGFIASCENTSATAITQLVLRDCHMEATGGAGGVVQQTAAGRVTDVRLDNCTQTGGIGITSYLNGANLPTSVTVTAA